jgi:hypothetical protein
VLMARLHSCGLHKQEPLMYTTFPEVSSLKADVASPPNPKSYNSKLHDLSKCHQKMFHATGIKRRLTDCGCRSADHAFKASAFKKAARALEEHPVRITNGKQAQKVPSVGKGSAAYVRAPSSPPFVSPVTTTRTINVQKVQPKTEPRRV